jgi:hypothetical protein
MNIKGKEYMLVNDRVKLFREKYPNGDIETEIIKLEDGLVVIKADIYDNSLMDDSNDLKRVPLHLASGTAYEKESSSFINKTSYIENCETSAVGRALGFLGIGIDTSIASAEEVENAIEQQKNIQMDLISEPQLKTLQGLFKQVKNNKKDIYEVLLAKYGISDLSELKDQYYGEMLLDIKSYIEEK